MQSEDQFNNFNEDTINIREELEKYLYYWKWFILSGFVCLVLAFLYLRYTPNQYEVATTILIDDEDGGLASELSAFEDLGLMGSKSANLDNEIELLKSRTLMETVAKQLELNVTYLHEGRVLTSEIYGSGVPVKVNFFSKDSIFYEQDTTFSIKINSANEFDLLNVNKEKENSYLFGQAISTEFGDITVTPSSSLTKAVGKEIIVKLSPTHKIVEGYRNGIQIAPVNKNASVIQLSLKHNVKKKAADILDQLVKQYNLDAVEDKSEIARNTNDFINERLEVINIDLSKVEEGAEDFKTKNKITDLISEAGIVLENKSEIHKTIVDLSTQMKLADYMIEYMRLHSEDLIPANLGLKEASINANSDNYNTLLLERNRILQNSSLQNPVIVSLDAQIAQLRQSISESLNNFKSTIAISLNEAKQQEYVMNSKISSVPNQERIYRSIEREQQIIESLYLYLLEKREENAITLAVTAPNSKVIDRAYGSDIPVAPKRKIIYLAALLLGAIIPFAILYIKFLLDNKVHTRKDVEAVVKAPVLGDIPKTKSPNKIVVSETSRDSIAESFRLLRTNVNFMLSGVKSESKNIFVTSTLSGEGKTFIALNMATALALSNKKVLLIGADIRKPKLAEYLNITSNKGLTHYLMDANLNAEEVIEHVANTKFDIVNSGVIAPNPSELLMNGRFTELLEFANSKYDYVIIDTAPVNLVTDTLLLGSSADLFVYVVRANFLDKRMLEIPKLMYEEKRLPNMALLVNDSDYEKSGYGYGYGYGYGDPDEKLPWYKKIRKKS